MNHVPSEKFVFTSPPELLSDFDNIKSRTYISDALLRFRKNRSSVVAALIIAILILYAVIAPAISPYDIEDKDSVYAGFPPYTEATAGLGIGFLDGGVIYDSRNENSLMYFSSIAEETGLDPLIGIVDETETVTVDRGQETKTRTYKLRVNKYYEVGAVYRVMSVGEFENIQRFQNETGIQVILPFVNSSDTGATTRNANIRYKVGDSKGTPIYGDDGKPISAYSTDRSLEGAPYDSLRHKLDRGDLIYSVKKGGAVECRVCYYNYYIYKNGSAPRYPLGTTVLGQDLFCAIGLGARFSLIFAIIVSAINVIVGALYGAIQGYYGGTADLILDRVADLISGMPFIVVATLFSLHLSNKVGTAGSFLFAFVLTGWIGMAALTRKQFYRYKGREFVLAARTLGASDGRLMIKHILPNSIGTLITGCAMIIPGVIGSETTFSYLGIINLTEFTGTSLGTLMSQGQTAMTTSPHTMLFPALYFSLLLISFNLFGNGLRDAFNPLLRGGEG